MILVENLVSSNGLMLLIKETIITQEHIAHFAVYEEGIGGKLIFPVLNSSIDALRKTEDEEQSDTSTPDNT